MSFTENVAELDRPFGTSLVTQNKSGRIEFWKSPRGVYIEPRTRCWNGSEANYLGGLNTGVINDCWEHAFYIVGVDGS